jgi:hypothetical protein
MRRVDREALCRAIEMKRQRSEADRLQIERKLANPEESWLDVATFASYSCQCHCLHLEPWQSPPCWAGDERPVAEDSGGHLAAWMMRQRLIDAGLSIYEPDPVAALAAIKTAHPA